MEKFTKSPTVMETINKTNEIIDNVNVALTGCRQPLKSYAGGNC